MAQLAILTPDTASASAPETAAIDRGHLARMTFGDRGLERELLELFDKQAAILLVRMRSGGSAAIFALAHTLKGSANSIGARGVALAAEAAERAARGSAAECGQAVEGLAQAIDAARTQIAELLREH